MINRAVRVQVTVEKLIPPNANGPKQLWVWNYATPTNWILTHGLDHITKSNCGSPMCVAAKKMILSGQLVQGKDF